VWSGYARLVVLHLLPLAYDLLQKEEYGKRLQQHLLHRHRTPLDRSCPLTNSYVIDNRTVLNAIKMLDVMMKVF